MKSSTRVFIGIFVICVTTLSAFAALPSMINYQGRLLGDDGNPVPDDDYQMLFAIYNVQENGTALWTSGLRTVPVNDGFFEYQLGSINYVGEWIFTENSEVYLSVTVGGEELLPRTRLVTVPYAFQAFAADSCGFAFESNHDYDWTIAGDDIYKLTGKVGIGTSTPSAMFEVNASAKAGTAAEFYGDSPSASEYTLLALNSMGSAGGFYSGFSSPPTYPGVPAALYGAGSGGNYGMLGTSESGTGIYATSIDGYGLRAGSVNGWAAKFLTGNVRVENDLIVDDTIAIGTIDPKARFHLCLGSGASVPSYLDGQFLISNADYSGGYAAINLISGSAGSGTIAFGDDSHGYMGMIRYDHSIDGMKFVTSNTSRMIINSDGEVGIGTDAPNQQLHVDGNIRLVGSSAGPAWLLFGETTHGGIKYDKTNEEMTFTTNSFQRVTIDADGNVGIGTIEPSAALDVAGGARFGSTDRVSIHEWGNEINFSRAGTNYLYAMDPLGKFEFRTGGSGRNDLCIDELGRVGVGTASPSVALEVNGSICYTGTIGACSDARYKTEIRDIKGALEILEKLRGVKYRWRQDEFSEKNFDSESHIGFIAQDIRELLPEIVSEDDQGFLSVDYGRLTPLLVEAVKELMERNNLLEAKMAEVDQLKRDILEIKANIVGSH